MLYFSPSKPQIIGDNDEIQEEAQEIIRESLEMSDRGPVMDIDEDCVRCGDEAVWCDPVSDNCYCGEHSKEFFRERHS